MGGRGSSSGKGSAGGSRGTQVGTDGYSYQIGNEVSAEDMRVTPKRIRIKETGEIINFDKATGEFENAQRTESFTNKDTGDRFSRTTHTMIYKGNQGNYYAVQRTMTMDLQNTTARWSRAEKVTRLTRRNRT